ncbi:XRE family transcriptional regulator [Streptomyces sp. NBC_01438]|uniref:XRE family transcriptional regulator n=1 Tax=Streptomyces sp. NBC_01438 TaxID=2903866 RepID=UPI00352CC66B
MAGGLRPPPGGPAADTAERFAHALRALRSEADTPSYRQMGARTGQSPGALSDAAEGGQLPPLAVALAYAEACGGDRAEWQRRWEAARDELGAAPPGTHRRRWAVAVAGVVALALTATAVILANRPGHRAPPPAAADSARLFSDDDAFNRRHPDPRLSPDSARMVSGLLAPGRVELYTGTAGSLVYRATSGTPTYEVTAREHIGQWGPDPFDGVRFPWDPSWKAPAPDREWTVVIGPDGRATECWRTKVSHSRPSCEWGAVSDTRGSSVAEKGQDSGSGLSRLAGLITRADWKAGRIDHALSFGTPDNNDRHVFPAVGSDGQGQGLWRAGQFIWLDPSYDIDADTSLRPYERMVAKALQEYGAFDVKNAREFSFTSEYGSQAPGNTGDAYAPLDRIDFAKYLRVGTVEPSS